MSTEIMDSCWAMWVSGTDRYPLFCSLPSDHVGDHRWLHPAPVSTSRALVEPKTMADVIEALGQLFDDDGVAIVLARTGMAGDKYRA